mmetsp:Transcript_80619/g.261224  ORF Transcript_80619/g.261224 Transcript_80619/m.261224 type:complete len:942 (+) Transcript_80619:39-2864(+)
MAMMLASRRPPTLPGPLQACNEPGIWVQIRGPLSMPTVTNGDWKTWPHLASKDNWKKWMGARATELEQFLEPHRIYLNDCSICKAAGRGMQSGFAEHVMGRAHFKHLGRLLPDGEALSIGRLRLWHTTCIPAGCVRFNHADGVIEMCLGPEPLSDAPATNVACALALPAAPCTSLAVHPGDIAAGELPGIEVCPEENQWFWVADFIGQPTSSNGTVTHCPWLSSRNCWKTAIGPIAPKVTRLLQRYNIWEPDCKACAHSQDFETHVPASKHYDSLCSRISDAEPVRSVAKQMWQQWIVPGGAVRFNHIHGRVEVLRGWPPDENNIVEMGRPLPVGAAPAMLAASSSAMPALMATPAMPMQSQAMGTHALMAPPAPTAGHTVREQLGCTSVDLLPEQGVWFRISAPLSIAIKRGGDYKCYGHLNSRGSFKQAMERPADVVTKLLERYIPGFWPECKICDRSRGWQEHVPGPKHFGEICEKWLRDGVPLENVLACADVWDEWDFAEGGLRFNYLDGSVELRRGPPPLTAAAPQMSAAPQVGLQQPPLAAASGYWAQYQPPPPSEPPSDWSVAPMPEPQAEPPVHPQQSWQAGPQLNGQVPQPPHSQQQPQMQPQTWAQPLQPQPQTWAQPLQSQPQTQWAQHMQTQPYPQHQTAQWVQQSQPGPPQVQQQAQSPETMPQPPSQPTAPSHTEPEGQPTLFRQSVGLCMWLWQQSNEQAAAEVDAELQRAGIPAESFSCILCGQTMLKGVKQHLLSKDHVRSVCAKADIYISEFRSADLSHLSQSWDLPTGRITLHHLPLRVEKESSSSSAAAPPRPEWAPPTDVAPQTAAWAAAPQAPVAAEAVAPAAAGPGPDWQVPGTDTTLLPPEEVPEREPPAPPSAPPPMTWQRVWTQDSRWMWKFDDHTWFYEDDLKKYSHSSVGDYFYNEQSGRWFLESGEDKGLWA